MCEREGVCVCVCVCVCLGDSDTDQAESGGTVRVENVSAKQLAYLRNPQKLQLFSAFRYTLLIKEA